MPKRTKSDPFRTDEPKGWRKLQEKAQRERDPKKLAALIDQMNELLTKWEKSDPAEEAKTRIRRAEAHRL